MGSKFKTYTINFWVDDGLMKSKKLNKQKKLVVFNGSLKLTQETTQLLNVSLSQKKMSEKFKLGIIYFYQKKTNS